MHDSRFSLDIISRRHETMNERLVPYEVDGKPTVGAFGDEPYAIRFTNNTRSRVQVRLSVDGTDLLTAKPASLSPEGRMWVVEPHEKCEVKVWPEGARGGGQLLFAQRKDAVAAHTHGVTSDIGVIAAAVFVEGYVAPPRYSGASVTRGVTRGGGAYDCEVREVYTMSLESVRGGESVLRSVGPGTGVGKHEEQLFQTAAGLRLPKYETALRVRYVWWDDLVVAIRAGAKPIESPRGRVEGFPGERCGTGFKGIDLGKTPRFGDAPARVGAEFMRTAP